MILDTLKNASRYISLSEHFRRAFDYLSHNSLSEMEPGRYEIDGSNVYVMVQTPSLKSWDEGRWEAHRRFADIQIVLKGSEIIGFRLAGDAPVQEPYSEEKDLLFYREMPGDSALLRAGDMMVLFPEDAHRPCIRPEGAGETVKKAVVKVRLD